MGLPRINVHGKDRVLGCLPPHGHFKLPLFGSAFRGTGPSTWQEIDLSWTNPPVLDQARTSACVGYASSGGAFVSRTQSGQPSIKFSPTFVYAQINGGKDQGAYISDALTSMKNTGICKYEECPSNVLFKYQINNAAYVSAARYKVVEAYKCSSFGDILSAISLGFPVVLGIIIGQNFAKVDAEYVCPQTTVMAGGHAMCGVGTKFSKKRNEWLVRILNSWSTSFGDRGYAYLTKDHFKKYVDAFAIQSLRSNVTEDPPIAII